MSDILSAAAEPSTRTTSTGVGTVSPDGWKCAMKSSRDPSVGPSGGTCAVRSDEEIGLYIFESGYDGTHHYYDCCAVVRSLGDVFGVGVLK